MQSLTISTEPPSRPAGPTPSSKPGFAHPSTSWQSSAAAPLLDDVNVFMRILTEGLMDPTYLCGLGPEAARPTSKGPEDLKREGSCDSSRGSLGNFFSPTAVLPDEGSTGSLFGSPFDCATPTDAHAEVAPQPATADELRDALAGWDKAEQHGGEHPAFPVGPHDTTLRALAWANVSSDRCGDPKAFTGRYDAAPPSARDLEEAVASLSALEPAPPSFGAYGAASSAYGTAAHAPHICGMRATLPRTFDDPVALAPPAFAASHVPHGAAAASVTGVLGPAMQQFGVQQAYAEALYAQLHQRADELERGTRGLGAASPACHATPQQPRRGRCFGGRPAPRVVRPNWEPPQDNLVGFGAQYQPYCNQVISDELNRNVVSLLQSVKLLQSCDPPTSARGLGKRYFCSLKEVSKVLHRTRALIVAPDVKPSATAAVRPVRLLNQLLSGCAASGTPVIFALSRRGIGQVFGNDKSISVVAIISDEHCEQTLQSVLVLADLGRRQHRLYEALLGAASR